MGAPVDDLSPAIDALRAVPIHVWVAAIAAIDVYLHARHYAARVALDRRLSRAIYKCHEAKPDQREPLRSVSEERPSLFDGVEEEPSGPSTRRKRYPYRR